MPRPHRIARLVGLVAVSTTACFNVGLLKHPCPEGTAWVVCDGQAYCAPAGISSCGPNQAPLR